MEGPEPPASWVCGAAPSRCPPGRALPTPLHPSKAPALPPGGCYEKTFVQGKI